MRMIVVLQRVALHQQGLQTLPQQVDSQVSMKGKASLHPLPRIVQRKAMVQIDRPIPNPVSATPGRKAQIHLRVPQEAKMRNAMFCIPHPAEMTGTICVIFSLLPVLKRNLMAPVKIVDHVRHTDRGHAVAVAGTRMHRSELVGSVPHFRGFLAAAVRTEKRFRGTPGVPERTLLRLLCRR